jgi:hypothetical protein
MQALRRPDLGIAAAIPSHLPRVGSLELGRALEPVALLLLTLGTGVTRLATRSHYLFNWDAIQFALGVQRFDLVAHRPHPPGYLGYILLGRLFTALAGGRPEDGLVLLSAVAEAAAVLLAYAAARTTWGRFAGWSAAILLATAPLSWIYGGVALTYALDPLFTIVVLWAGLRALRGDHRGLVVAAVAAALAGAVRPTDELFLAAPVALVAWRTLRAGKRRIVVGAAAAMLITSLAWAIPLIVASGGLGTYLEASRELSARAADTSAVWKTGFAGLTRNGSAVTGGFAVALGLVLPVGVTYVVCKMIPGLRLDRRGAGRDYLALTVATVVPALGVYLLVHIGQLGYLLLLLPALLLPAGVAIARVAGAISSRYTMPVAMGLLALCAVANVAIYALPAGGMRDQVVQHDAYVAGLRAFVDGYDPATTVLVTSAEANGSYRLAEYYLGRFPVVALGKDQRQHAGEMFSTAGGAPEYDLARFKRAAPVRLPGKPRVLLVLDPGALRLVGDQGDAAAEVFGDGWRAWVVGIDPASSPLARGGYVYLRAEDCPCEGAGTTRAVPVPGRPL